MSTGPSWTVSTCIRRPGGRRSDSTATTWSRPASTGRSAWGRTRSSDHLLGTTTTPADDDACGPRTPACTPPTGRPCAGCPGAGAAGRPARTADCATCSPPRRRSRSSRAAAGLDADAVIDTVTSADDAGESKPAPDIVEVALRQLAARRRGGRVRRRHGLGRPGGERAVDPVHRRDQRRAARRSCSTRAPPPSTPTRRSCWTTSTRR